MPVSACCVWTTWVCHICKKIAACAKGVALSIILQLFGLKSWTNWAILFGSGSSRCANIFLVNVDAICAWFASFITIVLLLVFMLFVVCCWYASSCSAAVPPRFWFYGAEHVTVYCFNVHAIYGSAFFFHFIFSRQYRSIISLCTGKSGVKVCTNELCVWQARMHRKTMYTVARGFRFSGFAI